MSLQWADCNSKPQFSYASWEQMQKWNLRPCIVFFPSAIQFRLFLCCGFDKMILSDFSTLFCSWPLCSHLHRILVFIYVILSCILLILRNRRDSCLCHRSPSLITLKCYEQRHCHTSPLKVKDIIVSNHSIAYLLGF